MDTIVSLRIGSALNGPRSYAEILAAASDNKQRRGQVAVCSTAKLSGADGASVGLAAAAARAFVLTATAVDFIRLLFHY